MSGTIRVVPDPIPAQTVKRFVWAWLEDKQPSFSWPYPSEAEARRFHPPSKAALLELVIPRAETLAAIRADTWGDDETTEPEIPAPDTETGTPLPPPPAT